MNRKTAIPANQKIFLFVTIIIGIFDGNLLRLEESVTQLRIPVSDHVYKYLLKKCGTDHYRPRFKDFFGSLILGSIAVYDYVTMEHSPTRKPQLFTVIVPSSFLSRHNGPIDEKKLVFFNSVVDRLFKEEIFTYALMNKLVTKEKFIVSIRQYLDVYEIYEDDYSLDTLYRVFNRKKKRLKTPCYDHQHMQLTA